jgi:hypothetical protein
MVDVDSIMARIESSKVGEPFLITSAVFFRLMTSQQSMRNSIIVDADGANDFTRAFLCRDKALGFFEKPYSIDQVQAEIRRLQKFDVSLEALQAVNAGSDAKVALLMAYSNLYDAQGQLNAAAEKDESKVNAARVDISNKIAAWEDAARNLVKWRLSQHRKYRLCRLSGCHKI